MYTVSHDYYGILGVSKNATTEEISEQYKKLMKKHHPDQFKGMRAKYQGEGDQDLLRVIDERIREAEEMCKLLNEAFEVLSDPIKRKQYDDQAVEPSVPLPEISVHPTRITFGSLTEGQKKSLEFTVENKGGPPAAVNIDWEGNKPDWGELVIEPDEEKVFPIKVTVKVDTTGIPSGPKDEKIVVNVDGRIHLVEVFLAVTRPVVAPTTPTSPPTRTYSPAPTPPAPSPSPPTRMTFAQKAVVISVVAGCIWAVLWNIDEEAKKRNRSVWATSTAVVHQQLIDQEKTAEAQTQQTEEAEVEGKKQQTEEAIELEATEQARATATAVSLAPKGRIAFSSTRDGNWEIYVINADGSEQARLTNNTADDSIPIWSPDGSRIAFFSNRDGNSEIYIMNADGSEQINLTNNLTYDGWPIWSPDGSTIAFASNRSGHTDVYIMNPDGSEQINLTNNLADNGGQEWSPDGSRITFESNRDGDLEIYIMNADGSGQTNLTKNPEDDWMPNWGPGEANPITEMVP